MIISTEERNELEGKLLAKNGFPDPLEADKDDLGFGLTVAKAIENEWFRRHKNNSSRFYDNQYKYHRLRLYARGEQPISKYKKELAVDGDLSFLNLDWTPIPIIPKFVDIVVNGISNRLFSIKAEAVDKVSTGRKSKYAIELEKDMIAKELLMEAQQELGVDAFVNNPKQLPESSEEMELHMLLDFKLGIEIAAQRAIDYVMAKNNYQEVKTKFDYDVCVLGVGAMKHYYNESDGICVKHVDPANLVHSHSDDPYRRDCYYFGEVEKVPLGELKKINPTITDDELNQAKAASSDWDLYHRLKDDIRSDFDGHVANILHFTYKAYRTKVYKKKPTASGGVNLIRKDRSWNPSEEDMSKRGYEKIEKIEEVWYSGALVLGTNILLKWEIEEAMIKEASTNKALPSYVVIAPRVYDDRAESLVARMIPFADQIQLTHLKLQQIQNRMVPDGVFIDVDGLNEIDLGDGLQYNPKRALQLFFQTGSVVGRSQTGLGEFNHGKVPIQPLNNSAGAGKLQELIAYYDYNLNRLRDVTGLNEARDASTPDERTLVGVQKLAALNSNTATRHIQDAGVTGTKIVSDGVILRVADVLKYEDKAEELAQAIGAGNVSILEEIRNIPLHSFGIFIEVEPDAQEREYLEQNIQAALTAGMIYLDDASDIREIKDIKVANRVMKIRRQKKLKEEHQRSLEAIDQQSQSQAAAQQQMDQSAIGKIKAESEAKIAAINAEYDRMEKMKELEADLKSELMAEEFDYNSVMKGLDIRAKDILAQADFERKSRLQAQKATQQSRIALQTAETGPNNAVDFESENDNLRSIDLGKFEPQ